ncbi:MAG: hypothetical protein IPM50_13230 [Acidobacteriota bacterium]|nr:MAG: hypothetical protein IPM50_13230 [Acidobacteriota bacterium]
MKPGKLAAAFSALAILFLLQIDVLACACCVDRGFRFEGTQRTDNFFRDLLGEVKFADKADLYVDAAGFDMLRGLNDLKAEFSGAEVPRLTSETLLGNNRWTFDLRSPAGKTGTLTFAVPATVGRFMVDTFDSPPESVELYKEMRFSGPVSRGTGVFRNAAAKGTRFSLVLAGKGNGCDDASQFANWRLNIKGPKAEFSLFGKLGDR